MIQAIVVESRVELCLLQKKFSLFNFNRINIPNASGVGIVVDAAAIARQIALIPCENKRIEGEYKTEGEDELYICLLHEYMILIYNFLKEVFIYVSISTDYGRCIIV